MVRIERGNVVLDVEDYEVDHYLLLGYNVIDEQGRIVRASIPTNMGVLQAAYVENEIKIKDLEAEVAKLKAENELLKSKSTKFSKSKED